MGKKIPEKRKLPTPMGEVEGEVVDTAATITGNSFEIRLEDGTLLRFKVDIVEVCRVDSIRDPNGFPAYHVRSNNIITLLHAPESLRKT